MSSRMFWINHLVYILLLSFIPAVKNHDTNNEESHESFTKLAQAQRIQSPMLEVLMRLPRNFHDINSFKNFLRVKPDRLVNSKRSGKPNPRDVVDVQTYEIAQPDPRNKSSFDRPKREADQSSLEKPVHQQLVSSLTETDLGKKFSNSEMLIPVADAIRGPAFTAFPVKNFEGTDTDDPDHSKRRRDDSINNREDNSQRDKRTFPDVGLDQNESTTPLPFWKRKKENPPFITGRGSTPKANDYGAPQHRSADNGRESHSLKTLEKSLQTNEIGRPNQDSYYSSTNRRTYSRQTDNATPSTPKSVYDTLDYANEKKKLNDGRSSFVRNYDDKKETFRDARPTHEQYTSRQYTYNYPVHERTYYQPSPYPSEVIGRGVEYYHRTYEPTSGRIIYYADMPENGRHLDYRYVNPNSGNVYLNRPYEYDGYYKNIIPPYDYRMPNSGVGRPMDYMRTGRSNSQAYSYPYQERDKYQRDLRFTGGFDRGNRLTDDVRNKTYIIYDADEVRSRFTKNQYPIDSTRLDYGPVNNYPGNQEPYRRFPAAPSFDYYSQPGGFPSRNQHFPQPSASYWGFNQGMPADGRWPMMYNNPNFRSYDSPQVQLPLSTLDRNLPSRNLEKNKKA